MKTSYVKTGSSNYYVNSVSTATEKRMSMFIGINQMIAMLCTIRVLPELQVYIPWTVLVTPDLTVVDQTATKNTVAGGDHTVPMLTDIMTIDMAGLLTCLLKHFLLICTPDHVAIEMQNIGNPTVHRWTNTGPQTITEGQGNIRTHSQ